MNLQDAADLGTTLAAIATCVLVGFGLIQLRALKRQVESGQQSSDAAVSAAEAAHHAVREAARARVDEQVARVVVLSERPQWPPLTNPNLSDNGQDRLFDSLIQHGSPQVGREELVFPERAGQLMWFVVHGIVTNEGRSTARIRIAGEGEFITGESPLLPGETIAIPPVASEWRSDRSYLYREHVLRPGQTALFRWAASNTVANWTVDPAEGGAPRANMNLEVFDSAAHGVIDTVKIEVRARPLQAVPLRTGHWALTDTATDMDVIVSPTKRRYLAEEPHPE
ncbi:MULTISPECIES: hypothetical protein [unclassified Streptomyces]|uniref:hypothetical protein n=1 Tax=unclassified Streptomyces TaxID=2593676 RepID=UPI0029B1233F|nr:MULTISPECIES: hypothetical protein [unclassified Streptomyces]MDX3771525.1 hypothetical protein [Streptomyces sp. AK08-01B]MDX3821395.1 hypothetical protein [Streptomyces sp. AK08-01A]